MAKSKMAKISPRETERVVLAKYIRVSTDKQREEGYSIEIQKERLDGYARSMFPEAEHGVEYREYVDDGFSGGSLDRPMMKQLMEDVKGGEITHVLVLKLDRLSRSQKDTLYLIEDVFLPHNVAFISMGESFNTATPFGRAVVGILSVFAQLEGENIFGRTRSGMQKRVETGLWPGGGRVPFGYDYDSGRGTLVPNKDADTVRRIYDLYLQGYAMQSIADMCGLKYEKLAQQILTRKSNTGVIVYNGKEYPGRHEAIVSLETYNRAMDMMSRRSEKRFVSATSHLLTGLVYCGSCGAKMRYQKWGKAGAKLICYSQQKSKPYLVRDPDCGNDRPWADEVEDIVLDILFKRAPAQAEEDAAQYETQSMREILEGQRRELSYKLKRLYNLYASAEDDVLLDTIRETQRSIALIDEKISDEAENEAAAQNARDMRERLGGIKECWDYMTIAERQNILRAVINRVEITGNHVHIDFNY